MECKKMNILSCCRMQRTDSMKKNSKSSAKETKSLEEENDAVVFSRSGRCISINTGM